MQTVKVTDELVKACIGVILSDEKAYNKSLNYAVNYCKAAMSMTGHDLAVQCLYILNNITGWRNPAAKSIRSVLRQFAKNN